MDKYALLEDMARHIVDESSARRVYEKYDDKTGLLVACRRSDRMIDESMNRDDFDATPVLLHCGHTVCRGCAYNCVRAHENARYDTMFAMVDCPVRCNRQTAFVCDLGVEWLPIDIRRIRLLHQQNQLQQKQKSQSLMCSEHKDRVATARCTHIACAKFALMCAECDKSEHSVRNARDHVRVPASQAPPATGTASSSLCSTHQQPLTGVCITDSIPVCDKCLYDHVGHEFKRLYEVCSDWGKKLETLQRDTLIRAHILSDRAATVQHKFDHMVSDISTYFSSVVQSATARRNQLLFKARRWRKMQLEESKMLAAESSKLSATAMYERMLLQRALVPCGDSKSAVKKEKPKKVRPVRRKSSRLSAAHSSSSSSSSSAAAAAAATTSSPSSSSSDSVATFPPIVPDAVLGSIATQLQASCSVIEAQSIELDSGIDAMRAEDMSVTFNDVSHESVLDHIRTMGQVNIDPINICAQDIARLQSHGDTSSPSNRNSTKRKAMYAGRSSNLIQQQQLGPGPGENEFASPGPGPNSAAAAAAAAAAAGPSRKRRRRGRQSDSTT
jgi:B-box zinc finger